MFFVRIELIPCDPGDPPCWTGHAAKRGLFCEFTIEFCLLTLWISFRSVTAIIVGRSDREQEGEDALLHLPFSFQRIAARSLCITLTTGLETIGPDGRKNPPPACAQVRVLA
jgi:hypothetical protein